MLTEGHFFPRPPQGLATEEEEAHLVLVCEQVQKLGTYAADIQPKTVTRCSERCMRHVCSQ